MPTARGPSVLSEHVLLVPGRLRALVARDRKAVRQVGKSMRLGSSCPFWPRNCAVSKGMATMMLSGSSPVIVLLLRAWQPLSGSSPHPRIDSWMIISKLFAGSVARRVLMSLRFIHTIYSGPVPMNCQWKEGREGEEEGVMEGGREAREGRDGARE